MSFIPEVVFPVHRVYYMDLSASSIFIMICFTIPGAQIYTVSHWLYPAGSHSRSNSRTPHEQGALTILIMGYSW